MKKSRAPRNYEAEAAAVAKLKQERKAEKARRLAETKEREALQLRNMEARKLAEAAAAIASIPDAAPPTPMERAPAYIGAMPGLPVAAASPIPEVPAVVFVPPPPAEEAAPTPMERAPAYIGAMPGLPAVEESGGMPEVPPAAILVPAAAVPASSTTPAVTSLPVVPVAVDDEEEDMRRLSPEDARYRAELKKRVDLKNDYKNAAEARAIEERGRREAEAKIRRLEQRLAEAERRRRLPVVPPPVPPRPVRPVVVPVEPTPPPLPPRPARPVGVVMMPEEPMDLTPVVTPPPVPSRKNRPKLTTGGGGGGDSSPPPPPPYSSC